MAADIVSSISTALSLVSRLKTIAGNIKDAEIKNLLADLSLELAEWKMKMAVLQEENVRLMKKVAELESLEGEKCPSCRQRGWVIESSKPDPNLGAVGAIRRIYKCSLCSFTESHLFTRGDLNK